MVNFLLLLMKMSVRIRAAFSAAFFLSYTFRHFPADVKGVFQIVKPSGADMKSQGSNGQFVMDKILFREF